MSERTLPREIRDALRDTNATLLRNNKHYVYQFPSGKKVTISRTGSDRRFVQNVLGDIRRATL